MKILLVPSSYSPAVGGVEALTANLANTLQRSGHQVEVWTYQVEGRPAVESIDDVTVRRFPFRLPSRAGLRISIAREMAGTLLSLRHAAKDFLPDIIHVQCFSGNGVYATALAMATRRPLIVTLQGETIMDDHKIYDRSALLRLALRGAARTAFATTACSSFTLDHAVNQIGVRPRRSEVIYNGVDLAVEEEPVSLPERPYFASLGRVVHNKGFDLLLDAFHRFASEELATDLVIGGTGPALDSLEQACKQKGIAERVHFVGSLRPGQVATLLRSSRALVVPSRVEPFGIVVLEGWRAAVPVVATSCGGPPEFVDEGVTGYLVDPTDTAELASTLRRLSEDSDLRAAIGSAGKARLAKFSWESISSQYEALYSSAVKSQ